MALLVTLPNGATWNTGLSYFEQSDPEVYNFIQAKLKQEILQ